MEYAIGFGIAGVLVVLGLFVWLVVILITQPRASVRDGTVVDTVIDYGKLPTMILPTHQMDSNIGPTVAIVSNGEKTKLGHRQFSRVAFVSGAGGASTMVHLNEPFSSSSSSLKPRRARNSSRKGRKARRQ